MVSGGIDSAAALVKVLTETDDFVHAHHVRLVNPEGRWEVEERSAGAIINYCVDHYRTFKFSNSMFDFSLIDWYGIDVATMAFIGYQVARNDYATFFKNFNSHSRIRVVMGMQADDFKSLGYIEDRHAEMERIFNVCVEVFDGIDAPRPTIYLPNKHRTKRECWEFLPEELRYLTWSCRQPTADLEPCRACHACEMRAKLEETEGNDNA